MNDSQKEKLNDMLDSLIDNKEEQAQVNFHGYLEDKMKDVLGKSDSKSSVKKDD